jgi:hypothetical protein
MNHLKEHVGRLSDQLAILPAGVEKARSSLLGVVRSGFEGYADEVYEAYCLLKTEVSQHELQSIIAFWREQREQFERSPQHSSNLKVPKVFWPSSAIHFVQEGVPRFRLKSEFAIGGFESAFLEFEEDVADLISSPVGEESLRGRAYDLCVIACSRDLVNRIRGSLDFSLRLLIDQQTGPFWSEWSTSDRRLPTQIPSVATTSLAGLALLKLGSSDLARERGKAAAEWLLENQNRDGSWSIELERGGKLHTTPDVHVTISAMEAIARSSISGASHNLSLGEQWLIAQQGKNGLWEDTAFSLPQPTVLIVESLEYVRSARPRPADTYMDAAAGYFRRARLLVHERDATSTRLSIVTAHLGIEAFLYSLIERSNITKIFNKGQTIGMRVALTSLQTWMQQNRMLKPNEILAYSNELARLAYLRDEVVHKALSVGYDDASSIVGAAARFVSTYSTSILGFDCLD